jgi:hypothetical protein
MGTLISNFIVGVPNMETDVDKFMDALGQGTFKEKLAHLLSDAALGTYRHGDARKKGKVTLEFTMEQFGEGAQVIVTHKIGHVTPTTRGKKSEEDTTDTFMYVGRGGALSADQPEEEPNGQMVAEELRLVQNQ